jgi:dephospho-CoA kinase
MLKVGLTGNIGSGKSVVSEIFSIFGVPVYHADSESKKFLEDPAVNRKLRDHFGETIVTATGETDHRKLAGIVFSDETALRALNAILHPLVICDFAEWCKVYTDRPYILHEAAIIFESGVSSLFDKIIHVSCPKEIAIGRVMKRDGTDGNAVLKRMRFQMEDEAKAERSDYVIRNDGSQLLIPQVLFIHKLLSEVGTHGHDKVSPGAADA